MHFYPAGRHVRGFLASDTLATDAAVPLFDDNGSSTTLALNERLLIDSITITAGATACVVTLYADTDGSGALNAGEELFVGNIPVNGVVTFRGATIAGRQSDGATKNKLRAVASANSVGTKINLVGRIIST